jgi:hypothetical protein
MVKLLVEWFWGGGARMKKLKIINEKLKIGGRVKRKEK